MYMVPQRQNPPGPAGSHCGFQAGDRSSRFVVKVYLWGQLLPSAAMIARSVGPIAVDLYTRY